MSWQVCKNYIQYSRSIPYSYNFCFACRKICCKDPDYQTQSVNKLKSISENNLCPSGYTGLRPIPYDCNKFANCWKGITTIQSCGSGLHFNARYSVCDWPAKANCQLAPTARELPDIFDDNVDTIFSSDMNTDSTDDTDDDDDDDNVTNTEGNN